MPDLKTDEPVLLVSAVTAGLGLLGTELVTHGVITETQASSLTKSVLPPVVAALVLLAGWAIRRLVTPARKVEDLMTRAGLLSDADHARIEAAVSAVVRKDLGVDIDWDAKRAALTPVRQAGPEHQLPGGGGLAAGGSPAS